MPQTVDSAFREYLSALTPTTAEQQAATLHRVSIETALRNTLDVVEVRETGSFSHGTALRGVSDVDLVVALNYQQPIQPATALHWVRDALRQRYPMTEVKTRSPTVVVPFANGTETFEVVPGFVVSRDPVTRYRIANPAGGWMDTAPRAHLDYVTLVNQNPLGGAKSLARLLKAWKHGNRVPVSSFYLEMAAAEHMMYEPAFEPLSDLHAVFAKLSSRGLSAIEDPTGHTGRIHATSSLGRSFSSLGAVQKAEQQSRQAFVARHTSRELTAFGHLSHLFGGAFPRYS